MSESKKMYLRKKCQSGQFSALIEKYVEDCQKKNVFPNVAGFCRFFKIGINELESLREDFPGEIDLLCTCLEDEALNSDIAAALITPYLKRRLGYGDEKKTEKGAGGISVVFKHDILKDGE